jgi:hypothetical protein
MTPSIGARRILGEKLLTGAKYTQTGAQVLTVTPVQRVDTWPPGGR